MKPEDPKAAAAAAAEEPHGDLAREFDRRRKAALAMGGAERLARRRANNVLDARERLDRLLDRGTLLESGLFATSSSRLEDRDGIARRIEADRRGEPGEARAHDEDHRGRLIARPWVAHRWPVCYKR